MDGIGQNQETSLQAGVHALLEMLEMEQDEVAVLSLAASREDDGAWRLRLGSLLVGPLPMAELSWPEWDEHDRPTDHPLDLTSYGITVAHWRTFDHIEADWRFVRFALRVPEIAGWLAQLCGQGVADVPNGLGFRATVQPADALLTVFPHVDTRASLLAPMAWRPVLGWVHPLEAASNSAEGLPPVEWEAVPGRSNFEATLLLAGIGVTSVDNAHPPQGLLVGRLSRGAWIASMRGAQPELRTFDVRLRLDPARVSLWELVLDLEEMDSSGELLSARRIRLADINLPLHGADDVTVKLPTLGARVVRRLRLYDLDGRLLDAAEGVHLVERINLSLNMGGMSEAMSIGEIQQPTMLRRLEDLNRAEREHRELLEAGVPRRIVVKGADGVAELRNRLAAARNELLIYDPYFGKNTTDWDVLRDVAVPIRLLTSMNTTAPPGAAPHAPSITCRRWIVKKTVPFPFHDRGYLWDGSGVSVGTSVNGLGGRVSLIDVIEPALSAQLVQMFNVWWQDPGLRTL